MRSLLKPQLRKIVNRADLYRRAFARRLLKDYKYLPHLAAFLAWLVNSLLCVTCSKNGRSINLQLACPFQ